MFSREKAVPMFEESFHHEGRGPELQRIIWGGRGAQVLQAIEYYNPEDEYTPECLKWVRLVHPEAFAMASEEVHGAIRHTAGTHAAIHRIENSKWKESLQPRHLESCTHFQLMFYDEIFDVICQSLEFGIGRFEQRNHPDAGPAARK